MAYFKGVIFLNFSKSTSFTKITFPLSIQIPYHVAILCLVLPACCHHHNRLSSKVCYVRAFKGDLEDDKGS